MGVADQTAGNDRDNHRSAPVSVRHHLPITRRES
jgi:hypothetical protein